MPQYARNTEDIMGTRQSVNNEKTIGVERMYAAFV